MRLLIWNIQHGGANRLNDIVEEIEKHNADVIVLTEYQDSLKASVIKERLSELGYRYQFNNSELEDLKIIRGKKKSLNSVLICSKVPLSNSMTVNIEKNEERVIKVDCSGMKIYAMYFPQGYEKRPVFDFLLNEIDNDLDEISLFLGDFNTGNNVLDRENPNSMKFHCEEQFNEIENKGYKEIWRYFNKNNKEYTYYSSSKNGFRIDHAFIKKDKLSLIKDCYYIHEPRENKISDHSIMIIEFDDTKVS